MLYNNRENFPMHVPHALKNDCIHVTFFDSWLCCTTQPVTKEWMAMGIAQPLFE